MVRRSSSSKLTTMLLLLLLQTCIRHKVTQHAELLRPAIISTITTNDSSIIICYRRGLHPQCSAARGSDAHSRCTTLFLNRCLWQCCSCSCSSCRVRRRWAHCATSCNGFEVVCEPLRDHALSLFARGLRLCCIVLSRLIFRHCAHGWRSFNVYVTISTTTSSSTSSTSMSSSGGSRLKAQSPITIVKMICEGLVKVRGPYLPSASCTSAAATTAMCFTMHDTMTTAKTRQHTRWLT